MNEISQLQSFSLKLPYCLIEVTAALAKWRLFSEAEQIKNGISKTGKTIDFLKRLFYNRGIIGKLFRCTSLLLILRPLIG